MIFPNLDIETIVQVGDKTRISGVRSFASPDDSIDQMEIQPSSVNDFIDVTGIGYLDWAFGSEAITTVTLRLNGVTIVTGQIKVVSAATDYLFSSDADLRVYEPDILNYVVDGRNSYLDVHRRVQHLIINQLMRDGYRNEYGLPYTATDILNIEGVHEWAVFWALKLIEEGLSNSINDEFDQKAKYYDSLAATWSKTTFLSIDGNDDGTTGLDEGIDLSAGLVLRR